MAAFHEMSIKEMADLEGVKDLPTAIKVKFIKALQNESQGNYTDANKFLDEAIVLEAQMFENAKK